MKIPKRPAYDNDTLMAAWQQKKQYDTMLSMFPGKAKWLCPQQQDEALTIQGQEHSLSISPVLEA